MLQELFGRLDVFRAEVAFSLSEGFNDAGAAEEFRLETEFLAAEFKKFIEKFLDRHVAKARGDGALPGPERKEVVVNAADFCNGVPKADRDTGSEDRAYGGAFGRRKELPGVKINS